jgi:hypothetical protein
MDGRYSRGLAMTFTGTAVDLPQGPNFRPLKYVKPQWSCRENQPNCALPTGVRTASVWVFGRERDSVASQLLARR